MWSWEHAALGYLLGRTIVPVENTHGFPYVALLFGTQFPDLVDKPLAWSVAVLPTGRSLAHSLITFTLLVAAAWWLTERIDREEYAIAFGIGYASHLVGDSLQPIINLDLPSLTFLLWPVLPSPTYDIPPSFSAHLANLELTFWLSVKLLLVATVVLEAVWTEYDHRAHKGS